MAVKASETAPVVAKADAPDAMQLAPGYLLRLSSLEDKKLNGQFRVEFDGFLYLPYQVAIQASGVSLADVSRKIVESYRPFFKGEPRVQVSLEQRKLWVDVRGLVKKPGKILVFPDTGIDEILALVDGFLPNSNVDSVRLDRAGAETTTLALGPYFTSGDASNIPRWRGGERIFFHSSSVRNPFFDEKQNSKAIRVLGEVKRPGLVPYREDADFLYYFTQVEGPSTLADLKKIEIVRGRMPGAESIVLNFESEKNLFPKLLPGDMILVHADRPTQLERTVPVLSGIAAVVSAVLLSILVFK